MGIRQTRTWMFCSVREYYVDLGFVGTGLIVKEKVITGAHSSFPLLLRYGKHGA